MDLVCQVCGRTSTVAKWQPEYAEARQGKAPAYICPACQDRIRAEAQKGERRPS